MEQEWPKQAQAGPSRPNDEMQTGDRYQKSRLEHDLFRVDRQQANWAWATPLRLLLFPNLVSLPVSGQLALPCSIPSILKAP
jgi:hypothetical protein